MTLFEEKSNCCGCETCANVCAKNAITMVSDEYGFRFPKIDTNKCVDCGLCSKVCAFQHIQETNMPHKVYVAASTDKSQIVKSASGGVFAVIATYYLTKGGVVYGATLSVNGDKITVEHIGITSVGDLYKLQGSKYVQSHTDKCFREIRQFLEKGRQVVFSGTPCQCAGLKGYLRKPYANLLIIDIICHGVPNQQLLNDYLKYQYPSPTGYSGFAFRDKTKGWGLSARLDYKNGKNRIIPAGISSYYSLFLDSQIYRESCYQCKYACNNRPGDLTLGDYWGIQKEHPELLCSGKYNAKNGISCIIVNSTKGQEVLHSLKGALLLDESSYEKVSRRNAQLLRPSPKGKFRETIFGLYHEKGYEAVDRFYRKHYKKQRIIHSVFSKLPFGLKSIIQKLIH